MPRRLTYLILTVAGVAALFLIWSAWHNSHAISDAEMLKRLPASDAVVLSIDFSQLRHSNLFEKLTGSKVMEEADYQAFVRDTGFDYKRDLDRALASFTASGTFFVVRGRFDWKRLQAYAKQSGGDCYNDLCHMQGSQPDRHISFLPLAKDVMGLAVTTSDSAASQLLQPTTSTRPIAVPAEPVWVSMPGSALHRTAKSFPVTGIMSSAFPSIQDLILTLGPRSDNFAVHMEARCRTPQEAENLNAQLRTVTSLLQSTMAREKKKPDASNLSGVLTAGQFRQSDKMVYGEWAIDKALVQNLIGK